MEKEIKTRVDNELKYFKVTFTDKDGDFIEKIVEAKYADKAAFKEAAKEVRAELAGDKKKKKPGSKKVYKEMIAKGLISEVPDTIISKEDLSEMIDKYEIDDDGKKRKKVDLLAAVIAGENFTGVVNQIAAEVHLKW